MLGRQSEPFHHGFGFKSSISSDLHDVCECSGNRLSMNKNISFVVFKSPQNFVGYILNCINLNVELKLPECVGVQSRNT